MEYSDRFKDYKERYYFELDVREKIETRLRASFPIFLLIFALIAYLFDKTINIGYLPADKIFWSFYLLGAIAFIFAIFFQIKAMHGYSYSLVPTPNTLETYYEKILEDYAKINCGLAKAWTKEVYENYLFTCYVAYTSQNTSNNDTKALNSSRSLSSLILAFLLVSLSYIPFYSSSPKGIKDDTKTATTTAATASTVCEGTASTTNETSDSN
ncbi:hypothetical protein NQT74_10720 [Alteromonas stellipolaris]|uniref:hypothetical protein n=1 Tax=Alteromonas stellipolaris TaxID=233316 RepID=UPI0021180F95|nr:hypothetical protein [Alteromonas stellipolaris]MCQ8849053.1 hypothetical protein [Alteromonas stellipolaris]